MALDVTSQAHIRVMFTVKDDTVPNDPGFTDALYFTQAEFAALTNPQIRALAVARYNAWKNAPPPPQPQPLTPKQRRDLAVAALRDAVTTQLRDLEEIPLNGG